MESSSFKITRKAQNSWEDDVLNDIKQLSINDWRRYMHGRTKWKVFVETAKTLIG
jgi:hypothetical protein